MKTDKVYITPELIGMKLLLDLRLPNDDYPDDYGHEATVSLNFYGDHCRFEMDNPDKEIEPWLEMWECMTEESIRDIANFLEWLNSRHEFLNAAQKLHDSFCYDGF